MVCAELMCDVICIIRVFHMSAKVPAQCAHMSTYVLTTYVLKHAYSHVYAIQIHKCVCTQYKYINAYEFVWTCERKHVIHMCMETFYSWSQTKTICSTSTRYRQLLHITSRYFKYLLPFRAQLSRHFGKDSCSAHTVLVINDISATKPDRLLKSQNNLRILCMYMYACMYI